MPQVLLISALAKERDGERHLAQQPPAMRVGLKLKQKNILSSILVIVQVTNYSQERMFLWQIV